MIIADTHCHTSVSAHAFSSLKELATQAKGKGLLAFAVTDHAPGIPDGAHEWHFATNNILPRKLEGVTLLKGVELNVMDRKGTLDLPEFKIKNLEWVIASLHEECIDPGDIEENSEVLLKIAKNPYIDVIGHCSTDMFKFDYEAVIPELAKNGKLIEINNHSLHTRPGALYNIYEILRICKKVGANIVVSSDAHIYSMVGDFETALKIINEVNFPEENIINASFDRLAEYIKDKRGIDIREDD